ncbi:hypothetical protein JTE90_004826 [Oedothorax gibbosus]|uniref:Uncharacterized protein n=1 Tax=Oedothorax gibbosus TaxID=931172 RepID=A0AAV6UT73_9ARAC|nr:hypothetical protein JTE90_004826 [Oedothorax gibbosus]
MNNTFLKNPFMSSGLSSRFIPHHLCKVMSGEKSNSGTLSVPSNPLHAGCRNVPRFADGLTRRPLHRRDSTARTLTIHNNKVGCHIGWP